MTKRMIVMLLAVVLVVGGLLGFKYMMAMGAKKFLAAKPADPQTVSTMNVAMDDWAQELLAVGSLRAAQGADIASEVSGIIDDVAFDSGVDVEEGAVLVHLRDDDAVAQLRTLEASARLARLTYERNEKQLKGNAVSQAAVDQAKAALDQARAQVDAQRAVVAKRTIKAPFKGQLGIRKVDVGQYLNAGTAIVTLQQLDPVYVDFNVPERELPELSLGQKVELTVDALGNQSFDGEILAINAKIEEETRNILVRASFKNPERKLLPGMFAHVRVTTGDPEKFLTLPQTAITYNPYGDTVFVVKKDEKGDLIAQQVFVTLGATRGDQVAVLSGIEEGDEIVTSGQLKLRNGTPLVINNELQPKNESSPEPKDH